MRNATLARTPSFTGLFALLVAACSGGGMQDGGAVDGQQTGDHAAPGDGTSDDVAGDAGTAMFGPCTSSSECAGGAAAFCLTQHDGFPNGQCTRRCTTDTQCGDGAACLQFSDTESLCRPTCSQGSDCTAGYNCFAGGGASPVDFCAPLCTSDTQCPGATCDLYSGFCGATDNTLADNGAPCTANGDCRSLECFPEIDDTGAPTGYLDGLCASACVIPSQSLYAGSTLPRGGCAGHAVCIPGAEIVPGDVGDCLPECMTDGDCRPGYLCSHDKLDGTSGSYTNGFCDIINCRADGQACPAGSACQTTANDGGVAVEGICAHTGDAGVPTDAARD